MTVVIDHIVIGAQTLEQGQDYLKGLLAVDIPRGGTHDTMGTHNCVMQIGNNSFLEVLAIDPSAKPPSRRRWFSMDHERTQQNLAMRPRPLCWVVGTIDLDAIVRRSPVDLGEIISFRRGDRTWRMTVPADGHLPGGGLLPAFIEWSPGVHPSVNQQDLGVRLSKITLHTPEVEDLTLTLLTLGVEELVEIRKGPHQLSFELTAPSGNVVLG